MSIEAPHGIRFALFLLLVLAGSAHPGWERTYGDPCYQWARVVQQTSEGGYVLTCVPWTLLKVDDMGNRQWEYSYNLDCFHIVQTQDGGYALTGYQNDSLLLVKTDENGIILWTRTYGGSPSDEGDCLQQTPDGGYIILGYRQYDKVEKDSTFLWLIRTDSMGDTIWTFTRYDADGRFVIVTADSGYVVTGNTEHLDVAVDMDILLFKVDDEGNLEWEKTYGWGRHDVAHSVYQTSDGGYALFGWTRSFRPPTDEGSDFLIFKTDEEGDSMWMQIYGDTDVNYAYSGQQTIDDGYVVLGTTTARGAGESDIWLVRMNSAGDTLWTRTYGGPMREKGYFIQQTSDTGYIFTGYTESFGAGAWDAWLVKVDPDTLIEWVCENPVHETAANWKVITGTGSRISLGYLNMPHGFHAEVFDIAGQKVDEICTNEASGVVSWGESYGPGVYFIKVSDNAKTKEVKVVLIK
jgi:hypothetical protein